MYRRRLIRPLGDKTPLAVFIPADKLKCRGRIVWLQGEESLIFLYIRASCKTIGSEVGFGGGAEVFGDGIDWRQMDEWFERFFAVKLRFLTRICVSCFR
jgi:hypothetical protein